MVDNKPLVLFVESRAQAAIYECEMKGQISDGQWENSTPHGHWKIPCAAEVRIDHRPGRTFDCDRGYNFANGDLFTIVKDRMLRFARTAQAFPDLALSDLSDIHWSISSPLADHSHAEYHNGRYGEAMEKLGVTAEEFEARLAAVPYSEKDLKRDCRRLNEIFRMRV